MNGCRCLQKMVTDEHGWIQKMPIICRCWDHLTLVCTRKRRKTALVVSARPPKKRRSSLGTLEGIAWTVGNRQARNDWTNRRLHQENKHVEQLWMQGRQNDLGRKTKELEISMTLASINLINHTHFYRSMTLHDFACSSLRASLWSLVSKSVLDVKWSLFNFSFT